MNRQTVWLAVCFVAFLAPAGAIAFDEERSEPTIAKPDLIAGIRELEDALRSFTVTSHFDIEQHLLRFGAYAADAAPREIRRSDKVRFTVDADGRGRCEAEGTVFAENEPGEYASRRLVSAFDGTVTRRMSGRAEFTEGHISSGAGNLFEPCNPRNFVTHSFDEPVSQILATNEFTITGMTSHEGREVLAIETTPIIGTPDIPDVEQKFLFLVDLERGFQIVRKALAFRFPNNEWTERSLLVVKESVQHPSGVWLPSSLQLEAYGFPMNASTPASLLYRYEIRNEEWDLPRSFDAALFSLEFVPGVYVTDEVSHKSYAVASPPDQKAADQSPPALPPAPPAETSRATWNRRTLIALNVAFLGAAAIIVFVVARRRGKGGK
jgi:hypothetical protein